MIICFFSFSSQSDLNLCRVSHQSHICLLLNISSVTASSENVSHTETVKLDSQILRDQLLFAVDLHTPEQVLQPLFL